MGKKHFLRTCAAALASVLALSGSAVGSTVHAAEAQPDVSEPQAAAPAAETIEVIPSIKYESLIVDTDDYITAVRATTSDPKEVENAINAVKNYKSKVDNSKEKYFPPIGDQGSVGSCSAWANVYYQFTYQVNKMLDREATRENSFNPMFLYSLIVGGHNVGTNEESYYNLLNAIGCATFSEVESDSNYTSWNAKFETWRAANNYRISSYMFYCPMGDVGARVTSETDPDLDAIKATLRNGDILCFSGKINSYTFKKLTALSSDPDVNKDLVGQKVITKMTNPSGGHAMTVVGYDDTIWTDINENGSVDPGEKGAFKMANSWGEWKANGNEGGFCWIAYDALNSQSVVSGVPYESSRHPAMERFYKLNVDRSVKPSQIYLKYTLKTSDRCDNYLMISARRKSDGVTFRRKTEPYRVWNSNGLAMNYDGTTQASEGTMICDLSNVISGLNSNNFNDYDWSVSFVDGQKDSAPLTVVDAIVVDEKAVKTYSLNCTFPFNVKSNTVSVPLTKCYNFTKLAVTPKETAVVGKDVKIVLNTENEIRNGQQIVYHLKIKKGKNLVYAKQFSASSVDAANRTASAVVRWKPTETGSYTAIVKAMDMSGAVASRSVNFKVYSNSLKIQSVSFDKGQYVGLYERVKIVPKVTGGKAPYTYSYYYIKGGKTYKIAENVTTATRVKHFGSHTGVYSIMVNVKDAKGKTASMTKKIVVSKAAITRLRFNVDRASVGDTIFWYATVKNTNAEINSANLVYSVSLNGVEQKTERTSVNTSMWRVASAGKYKVKAALVYKGEVVDSKEEMFEVSGSNISNEKIRIKVNVINYICDEYESKGFQLHYWNNSGLTGDVEPIWTGGVMTKNVGFWNTAQTFVQFNADIPKAATGFKFHVGNRWFPDGESNGDGDTSKHNTVYVFNYDYDRVVLTKE